MWSVGDQVRARRAERELPVEPFTAGGFIATMTAQIDELAERGHPWSEIVNESLIEAVDSLLPYKRPRDVTYMVDNCSRTARLGARGWARGSRQHMSRSPCRPPNGPRTRHC